MNSNHHYFALNSLLFIALSAFFSFAGAEADQLGCFKASEACEAYQSFRNKTNPNDVRLKENKLYAIKENNKKRSTFRIEINGVNPSLRWVTADCGVKVASCKKLSKKPRNLKTYKKKSKFKQPQYLLALSWQPSFCESHSGKKECRTQTRNRYDANHLSLHGLWPQPRNNTYCGVSDVDKGIDRSKKWHLLEPVKLSQETATKLAFIMPGAASNLQRHEWIKHGTCYGADAEKYYADSIQLTEQINKSIVGKLFTYGVGKRVTLKQVRQHFDKAFGKGSGSKVDMRCDKKGLVSELWINLKGSINKETTISNLLRDSVIAPSSCRIGRIDRANR